jgi:hypothetical protein
MAQWGALIRASASKYQIPAAWLAAIMALESGGKPGLCARLPDGTCAQNEGAGLMAILPSTASLLAGRGVSSQELLSNNALSIDLGAKYLRQNLDANVGDFVRAAVAYNAGSVRCGTGSTWRPSGSSLPKFPCPTTWNVIMGCVDVPMGSGNVVSNDYPRAAIRFLNAALDAGFGAGAAAPEAQGGGAEGLIAGALGIGFGFWVTRVVFG